jgi:hypothetical protein
VFSDPEGLSHALVVDSSGEAPLRATAPDVPLEHALLGFAGRAFSSLPARSAPLLRDALGFVSDGEDAWRVGGSERCPRQCRVFGGAGDLEETD